MNIEPNIVQPTTQESVRPQGEIDDNAIYEWGILIKDAHTTGTVDTAPFSPVKVGTWQGGSLSWTGALFRRGAKRAIRTFADFQRMNPLRMPTNKTFFFFKVTVDADGIRKKQLVHEGAFSEPKTIAARGDQRRTGSGYLPSAGSLADTLPPIHSASGEARSLRESMDRTISDLQRELDVCRRERDMLREQVERFRTEIDQNRTTIINIEGERIRHSVEREALEERYKSEISRLREDHEREIDRLEQEFDRELADARQSAEKAAIQTLNDNVPTTQKIMNVVSDVMNNPQLMGIIQAVAPAVLNKLGQAAGVPQQTAGMQPTPQMQRNPYEQMQAAAAQQDAYTQSGYTTAEAMP